MASVNGDTAKNKSIVIVVSPTFQTHKSRVGSGYEIRAQIKQKCADWILMVVSHPNDPGERQTLQAYAYFPVLPWFSLRQTVLFQA